MPPQNKTELEARGVIALQLHVLNDAYYKPLDAIPYLGEAIDRGRHVVVAFLLVPETGLRQHLAQASGPSRREALVKLVRKLLAHEFRLKFERRGDRDGRAGGARGEDQPNVFAPRPSRLRQVWRADASDEGDPA